MVDECHSAGVLGKTGRGITELYDRRGQVDILTGTLGKAFGGAVGGFTTGRREIIDMLRQRSRPYLFSNSLPPAVVGAGIEMFRMLAESNELHDRLAAMREGLCRMGADVRETPDGLTVQGGARLHGAAVDAWNDHRIAMALCVAAASCEGGTALSGAESVRKSAPAFYREYASLGGMTHALDVGE